MYIQILANQLSVCAVISQSYSKVNQSVDCIYRVSQSAECIYKDWPINFVYTMVSQSLAKINQSLVENNQSAECIYRNWPINLGCIQWTASHIQSQPITALWTYGDWPMNLRYIQWCPTCVSRETVSHSILFGVSLLYINLRARYTWFNACLAN